MKYRTRTYYTDSQKALMWERWKEGWTLHQIAHLFDRAHTSVQKAFSRTGGIPPPERRRSRMALAMAEREEISRAMAAGFSIRAIAVILGRAASTISREIKRNGGQECYRADQADQTVLSPAPCSGCLPHPEVGTKSSHPAPHALMQVKQPHLWGAYDESVGSNASQRFACRSIYRLPSGYGRSPALVGDAKTPLSGGGLPDAAGRPLARWLEPWGDCHANETAAGVRRRSVADGALESRSPAEAADPPLSAASRLGVQLIRRRFPSASTW